jgi:uncharacterized membrane protein
MTIDRIGRWSGPAMIGLALAGTAIALYLAAVKLSGGTPACVVVGGCDTVNSSVYAEFMGIPVALFGAGASAIIALGAIAWWRTGSRRWLLVAYLIGLSALPVLAYLTYVELFVIQAICSWCVAYAVTVVAGWLVATRALL